MSLMGTLAKVAIGVVVAKGVTSMVQKAGGRGTTSAGGGGVFGGAHSPGNSTAGGAGGGLDNILGDLLGGRTDRAAQTGQAGGGSMPGGTGGGLGDLMNELGRYAPGQSGGNVATSRPSTSGGGLDDLIKGLGQGSGGGGLGDLLGGLLGGLAGGASGGASGGGGFGDLLNQSLGNRGEPDLAPSRDQEAVAGLMLRAMIQAAKSDGKIDASEQRKLIDNLGEVSAEEKNFVDAEMRAPIDVQGLARQVPRGLEPQIYSMSVMAIDLDNRNEAQYLHQLATALGFDKDTVNRMHARLGVPALYA
ncbi:MAG: tellurite resistance TerB family protein [Defluviimonas sp.]|uniref:DUF533 domain-containing protein n=1 Tax=Albidovulum sp. TaxID=1872424 RepID=UPI001DE07F1D|nr:tellurite resistance TerB family protein [Paracoccaceae bacterium]MCC0063062.1 tellurite resistance TerB family protein [Defluviimonas sp.]